MAAHSFRSPDVQQLRRLIGRRSARHETGLFVVEGPTLAAELVAAGWTCRAQFVPSGSPGVPGAGPVRELADGVFERVASTQSPQPPLVLAEMREIDPAAVLRAASFALVLDQVRDPGNLGTILRSAEAAGVDVVVLTPGSVDLFSPKTVRASAGALFHVPALIATLDEVRGAGLRVIGTSSRVAAGRSVVDHVACDFSGRIALVFGNEAAGLPDEWVDGSGPVDDWVTVRHRGRAESLNVAMAATVLAFEVARQRGGAAPAG